MQRETYDIAHDFIEDGMEARYNIKPTEGVEVWTRGRDGFEAHGARWWLIPHWFRGDAKEWKAACFNARIEGVEEKPSFRDAYRMHRCLIPSLGYYEWQGEGKSKQPHFVRAKTNASCMVFAGIYSHWREEMTCAIMTRKAEGELAELHARMPIVLTASEVDAWLAGEDHEYGLSTAFEYWPVQKFGIQDEGAKLIEPLT